MLWLASRLHVLGVQSRQASPFFHHVVKVQRTVLHISHLLLIA